MILSSICTAPFNAQQIQVRVVDQLMKAGIMASCNAVDKPQDKDQDQDQDQDQDGCQLTPIDPEPMNEAATEAESQLGMKHTLTESGVAYFTAIVTSKVLTLKRL